MSKYKNNDPVYCLNFIISAVCVISTIWINRC